MALLGGTLIDGTGTAPVEGAYVFIANGTVQDAGCCAELVDVPEGYEIVDVSGMTVMPGLIDGHVHVSRAGGPDAGALRAFLNAGFTTLRDIGQPPGDVAASIAEAERLTAEGSAPRVVWAGPLVTVPGGYPLSVPRYADVGRAVASEEEGEALVDELAEAGARLVKLGLDRGYYGDSGWELLDVSIVRAIADRAHDHGMQVTAHVTGVEEVRLALDGGVDSIAHAPLEPLPDALITEMVQSGLGMVSTATVWGANQQIAAENARRYVEAGGSLSIGTDYGCCGQAPGIDSYLVEMGFLRSAGIGNTDLLVAATRGGAIVSNLGSETGTIESGKRADIIIVDGDPLADLGALRNLRTVTWAGRWWSSVSPRPARLRAPGGRTRILPAPPGRCPPSPAPRSVPGSRHLPGRPSAGASSATAAPGSAT